MHSRHDKKREKRFWWLLQPTMSKNSMKTHPLKHRHDRRKEKGGYSQPNTLKNS